MRRTYNFLFTKLNALQSNNQYPPIVTNNTQYDGSWLPANFLAIDFAHLADTGANSFEHFWSSPLNIYSVVNIDSNNARHYGCNKYTLIRLDWLGLIRCQFSGFFPEVTKQIIQDFQKYGYWRPGRITVKLIPKFGRPPSYQMAPSSYTFTSSLPVYQTGSVNLNSYIPKSRLKQVDLPNVETENIHGVTNQSVWGIPTGSHVDVPSHDITTTLPQLTAQAASSFSGTITTGGSTVTYTNKLAQRVVGYLIPSGYDTVSNTGESNAYVQMYQSVFSSASQAPGTEWTSSFRNVGYKRQLLSTRRSCKWSYKYSRYQGKVGVPFFGNTQTYEGDNLPYINNPWVVTRSYSGDTQTPYQTIHDSARLTWIRGDYVRAGIWRKEDAAHPNLNDPARMPIMFCCPQYQPLDFCNVYIPGFDVSDIFNLYDIRFSYTCKFSSRVFDNE